MTQTELFQLLQGATPYIMSLVVVPLLAWLISKLPVVAQLLATKIANRAVLAVEQIAAKNSTLDSAGKKALALEFAQQLLKYAHLTVPVPVLDILIETAVALLNQQKSAQSAPTPTIAAPATTDQPASTTAPVASPVDAANAVDAASSPSTPAFIGQ